VGFVPCRDSESFRGTRAERISPVPLSNHPSGQTNPHPSQLVAVGIVTCERIVYIWHRRVRCENRRRVTYSLVSGGERFHSRVTTSTDVYNAVPGKRKGGKRKKKSTPEHNPIARLIPLSRQRLPPEPGSTTTSLCYLQSRPPTNAGQHPQTPPPSPIPTNLSPHRRLQLLPLASGMHADQSSHE
jgi:hypothetical protein